jgi:hypothetical protein
MQLFIKEIAKKAALNGSISIIPLSSEKILTLGYRFEVGTKETFQLNFIDSYKVKKLFPCFI